MASNFNREKYKKYFESRYGTGSYDTGLSSARKIGRAKAQSEYDKEMYEVRKKAYEDAFKEAQKAQEEALKQEEKAREKKNEERVKKSRDEGRGGYLPSRKQQQKESEIQAEYKRTGQFPSSVRKDIDNLQHGKWQKVGGQQDAIKKYLESSNNKKYKASMPKKEEESKKKDPSFLDDLGAAGKAAKEFFNPFDDVKAEDAVNNFINRNQSKAFQETARGANRAIDSTTLGLMSNLDKKVNDRDPYYNSQRELGEGGITDVVTSGLGYLVPGVGAYKALGATKLGKTLESLGQQGLKQRLGAEAAKGALTGAGLGTTEVANRELLNPDDYSAKDNASLFALSTLGGAVADPALYGLGKAAMKGIEKGGAKLLQGDVPNYTGRPSNDVLSNLPVRNQSSYAPSNNDLLDRLTQRGLRPPEAIKTDLEGNSPRVEENPFSDSINDFNKAVDDQYNYLKESLANRKGVQQGGVIRDEMGEVVDRYGRISENPQWYQEFYAQNGKTPNNTELRALAEEQVLNGFGDEFGQVPSWRPKEVEQIDNQLEELNDYISTLENKKTDKSLASELEQYGLKEINPENIASAYSQKTWYHGTGTNNLSVDSLDPFVGDHQSLFGHGIYLTDDPKIAKGYADSRSKRTGTPAIYEANVKMDRVLDLEQPVTEEVLGSLMKFTQPLDYHYNMETGEENYFSNLLFELADKGETTENIIQAIRREVTDFSHGAEIPTSEFVENFQDLAVYLKEAGYDGITHTGGGRTGNDPHRVLIALDPNDTYSNTGRSGQISKFDVNEDLLNNSDDETAAVKKIIEALEAEREGVLSQFNAARTSESIKSNPVVVEENTLSKAMRLPGGVKAMQADTNPFRQDSVQTDKTISRQQVLNNMRKNLGVTIRTGKMGQVDKNVQGYFKVNPEVIRSKRHGDLQVISHEIGHHLDKKFNLTSDRFDNELLKLGKVTSGDDYSIDDIREEGLAEFIRLYLTDPKQANIEAPSFSKHFQNVIPTNVKKGLQKTQNDLDTWITQGPEKRFEGKIDFSGKEKQGVGEKVDKLYSQFVDKFDTLKKVEKEITGKISDASNSLYKKARLSVGAPKKGELILQDLKGILKPIDQYGYSMKDVSKYAAARHAMEIENYGIESGFTKEEIESVLNKFDTPEMKNIQQQLIGYNNKLLDMLQEGGVLSTDAVKGMREKYPDYVPFYRFFEDDMTAGWGNKGFANLTNPVKRLKGSTRDIINPLESMIKNTFAVVNAVEKNKVGLELSKLSKIEGSGKFIERLDGKAQDHKDSIVTVFENGEKVQYKVEPELYRSVQMLDEEATNILIKILSAPTNVLRAGATLTPEFMLRNPIRDQFQTYVVSNYGYNPVVDLPRGIWHVLRGKRGKSEIYKQWVEQGGGYGNYLSQDRNYLKEQLSQLKKEGHPLNKGVKTIANPKEWLRLLQSLSEISEEATKVGEFRKAIKQGASPEEAAFQSRDLMDFGRSGSITKLANQGVAFLNANVQGKDKLIRTFKEQPVRTTIRAVNAVTLPTIGAYLAMEHIGNEQQKESWRNTPKWVKDSFFILPIPGTDELARIPKPFDLAPIFSNVAERIMDDMYENDPESWNEFLKSTGSNLAKIPLMLTALTPVLENITNYSFFTGGPIVPRRDQDLMPQDQYGVNTSLTARSIGELTADGGLLSALPDQSPYKVDNFIRGYGAGLAQYGTSGLDAFLKKIRKEEMPTLEKKKWSELPVINAFTVDTTGGGKVMSDFYDTLEKLRNQHNSANRNGTTFENEDDYKMLNNVSRNISGHRKEYREVQSSTTLSPEQKRKRLDELDKLMNNLAKAGLLKTK